MTPKTPKTLIFDLGRVLIPFDFQRGYDQLTPLCNLEMEVIRDRLRTCGIVRQFESGEIAPREFVRRFGETLNFDIEYEQFCQIWSSIFSPDPLLEASFLASLRRRYRMVLLSNTNAIHFEMLERTYPLLQHFDSRVLSFEVGAQKPESEIYRAAIEAAQCRPEECFFTDDIPEFVQAARDHGIDAVQFLSREQLETELKARGVEW
jgi:putative hydrolase of the HAD superfamily